jgi:hypothetical protein
MAVEAEDNDDRQSAENVLRRAQEQLKVLASRGIDVQTLNKRFESAKVSLASGDFHDAEIVAGEIIVLAKATGEMARMSSNVAKQEDATRRQVTEAVRAELAKGLPQSPALDAYVVERAGQAFRAIISEDMFQQAVLGIATEAFNNLKAEIDTISPADLDQRLSVLDEKLASEAAQLARQAMTGVLHSSELEDKIATHARAVAEEVIPKTPPFTSQDAEGVAQAVINDALTTFRQDSQAETQNAISRALEEGQYVGAEKLSEELRNLESAIKSASLTKDDMAETARGIAGKAVNDVLKQLPKKDDLHNLASQIKGEFDQRLSALPTPEEMARSSAEAAHEEIDVLSKQLKKDIEELSGAVDRLAARETVGPGELASGLDEMKEKMREEAAAAANQLKEEMSNVHSESAEKLSGLESEIRDLTRSVKTLDKRMGELPPEAASQDDIAQLRSRAEEIAASVSGALDRVNEASSLAASKMEFAALADSIDELTKNLASIENTVGELPSKVAKLEDLEAVDKKIGEIASTLSAVRDKVGLLPAQAVSREEYTRSFGQMQKNVEAIKTAQNSLVARNEMEQKLNEFVSASDFAERVTAVVKPHIEETRNSIPEMEAVREVARTEAAAAMSQVPQLDAQGLEDRILEKVAPIVGALVGSDQFISNINMVLGQRIEDTIAGRGLVTVDEIETLVKTRVEAIAKKIISEREVSETRRFAMQKGKGEVDVKALAETIKKELHVEGTPVPEQLERTISEGVKKVLEKEGFVERLKSAPNLAAVEGLVEKRLDAAVSKVREELQGAIKTAGAAKAAGVDPAQVEKIVRKIVAEAPHPGIDEKKVRSIVAEAVASAPAQLDEGRVAAIVEKKVSALAEQVKSASGGQGGGMDAAAVKSIVDDAVAEALGQFYRRLPKSPQFKEVMAAVVKEAVPAGGHTTANVDPDALRPIIDQVIQGYLPTLQGAAQSASPEALKPVIEAVVREVAPQIMSAQATTAVSPEMISQAVEGQLLALLSDPEYIKSLMPETVDVEKIEKIARREGVQAVVQIFDSEEFAKRVSSVVSERGLGGGGGGAAPEGDALHREVRGALVEFMESDLFSEKINAAISQQGGAPAGGGGGNVEAMIKSAVEEIRQDLSQRMEKVEQTLPEIVAKIVVEKGIGAAIDPKMIEERVTAVIADKVLGDKLDPALIQAEIRNQTPHVVKEIANSDEFKVLIDDKFKVIMKYLKEDIIPKSVKKILKEDK